MENKKKKRTQPHHGYQESMEFIAENIVQFLEIHAALEKTLRGLNHESKRLDENEVNLTKNLKETLRIIEIGTAYLSRHDVTLLKSEKIFEFII